MVELIAEPASELELTQVLGQLFAQLRRLDDEVLVVHLVTKLKRGLRVVQLCARGGKRRHVFAGARQTLHHHACLLGIVPEPRKSALLLQACDFLATVIDVQVPLDLAQTRLERLDVGSNNVSHPIVPPGVRGNS